MGLSPDQLAEIAELRSEARPTLRATAPGIEAHLYEARPVLDHGFVRVVDYMGDDAAICQAARVSYGRGTKSVQNDEGLIRYLMRHWHSTPFEMCEIKLHVKLPVFVARQWIRHRTANVNEYSARYSILDREFYIPAPEHVAAQSEVNNQGRGATLEGEEAARVLEMLKADSTRAYDNYQSMISTEGQQGLARDGKFLCEAGVHNGDRLELPAHVQVSASGGMQSGRSWVIRWLQSGIWMICRFSAWSALRRIASACRMRSFSGTRMAPRCRC